MCIRDSARSEGDVPTLPGIEIGEFDRFDPIAPLRARNKGVLELPVARGAGRRGLDVYKRQPAESAHVAPKSSSVIFFITSEAL